MKNILFTTLLLVMMVPASVYTLPGNQDSSTPNGKEQASSEEPGSIIIHQNMKPRGLKPRNIRVWLPDSYHTDEHIRYQVLYLHDGQVVFQPGNLPEVVGWGAHHICDSLMNLGVIEPLIIVAIDNTADRLQEYTPGRMGKLYMNFITQQLKPFIDQHYRTMPQKENTTTAGASAGGVISFMLAWHHDDVFSRAICMSPPMHYNHNGFEIDVVKAVNEWAGERKESFFYIDNGGEAELQPGIDQLMQALRQKGYRQGETFVWYKDPQATHTARAWSRRLPMALSITYNQ